jgi:hypothetical protein
MLIASAKIHTKGIFGEATASRYDFLKASYREDSADGTGHASIHVNRQHTRRLHPHGLRLVKEGLMTLHREGAHTQCQHTTLTITPKGVEEFQRLHKKLDRKMKRNSGRA